MNTSTTIPNIEKSPGQLAYEADVQAQPLYPDNTARKTWAQLGAPERWSWERNPTSRCYPNAGA